MAPIGAAKTANVAKASRAEWANVKQLCACFVELNSNLGHSLFPDSGPAPTPAFALSRAPRVCFADVSTPAHVRRCLALVS